MLFTDTSYPQLQSTPIRGDLIKLEGEATYVRTPTLDGLLGDKLTAFAPTTTGVLYGSRKELEIIKQLFDLGVMYEDDFSPVPIAESGLDRSNYLIPNEIVRYNYLNRKLRSIEPSAQFYWYSALKILNKI